jgi:hypothetical protein
MLPMLISCVSWQQQVAASGHCRVEGNCLVSISTTQSYVGHTMQGVARVSTHVKSMPKPEVHQPLSQQGKFRCKSLDLAGAGRYIAIDGTQWYITCYQGVGNVLITLPANV